jgi:hypothetical protein
LLTPKVVIIDDMGYLPLDDLGATFSSSSSATAILNRCCIIRAG